MPTSRPPSAGGTPADAPWIDLCRAEVEGLHAFFSRWFEGRCPDDDVTFGRLAEALAGDFALVRPDGSRAARGEVLARVRSSHGAHAPPRGAFTIRIEDFRPRAADGDLAFVTYEEWQRVDGRENGRSSAALFRVDPRAPGGVAWLHVHEVALPEP